MGVQIVEKETKDYLVTQFNIIIDCYQSLETLKHDLKEFNTFMANAFDLPSYFSEYCLIHQKYLQYLKRYNYQEEQFSLFQRDLIKICLFDGYSIEDIHVFALPHLSDDEMESLYHMCYK